MKRNTAFSIILLTICLFCKAQSKRNQIKIILTAALIDKHFEGRKKEYIKSIETIKSFEYEPYIVESCKKGPSFLDEYSTNICYAYIQNPHVQKGVDEARSLLKACNCFNFDDEDMIIKLTGRYCFTNNYFINLVESLTDTDAVVRYWPHRKGSIFTGCFAMKYKYLKQMLRRYIKEVEIFRKKYGTNKIYIIEYSAASYIDKLIEAGKKVLFIEEINLQAKIFHSGKNYETKKIEYY